jgi:hypothetical protein
MNRLLLPYTYLEIPRAVAMHPIPYIRIFWRMESAPIQDWTTREHSSKPLIQKKPFSLWGFGKTFSLSGDLENFSLSGDLEKIFLSGDFGKIFLSLET